MTATIHPFTAQPIARTQVHDGQVYPSPPVKVRATTARINQVLAQFLTVSHAKTAKVMAEMQIISAVACEHETHEAIGYAMANLNEAMEEIAALITRLTPTPPTGGTAA